MGDYWGFLGIGLYFAVMAGVIALVRWADVRQESQCTGNCNQGRNCDCMPPPPQ